MSESPQQKRFPIARAVGRFAKKALRNWRERHRHPFNFAIHLFGIPMTLVGLGLLFVAPWQYGIGLFALGYVFQWVGHRVEGNDVGELIPIKRALGLPVVAVVPRADRPTS
ncbi:MAG: Mpo1-like protein [Gemmataceae bacterium]